MNITLSTSELRSLTQLLSSILASRKPMQGTDRAQYEIILTNAEDCAETLGLTLERHSFVPMCGFPAHALETYLVKLIRAGYKVAICDER